MFDSDGSCGVEYVYPTAAAWLPDHGLVVREQRRFHVVKSLALRMAWVWLAVWLGRDGA